MRHTDGQLERSRHIQWSVAVVLVASVLGSPGLLRAQPATDLLRH
jgi:hypothetical protein